ncbi:MAG: aldehyde dehydrogenase [Steroidobacteraceae bacterium]|jgi:acyl-CoA reductase-like NAD-dependent aldehyde dehydrogenase
MQKIFIAGAWLDAAEGAARELRNPATRKPLGAVPDCGREDVARAVAAAHAALPAWTQLHPAARGELLGEVAARIRARKSELAALATRENGVPLCESSDCIEAAAFMFERWGALGVSGKLGEAGTHGAPGGAAVVAALLPRNFPLLALGAAAAPALAAGATLVLLPPADNPLASLALAPAFEDLPAGAVNVITGGAETARALIEHAPAERVFSEPAAADAFIVCRDADLDLAVPGIAWERLRNGGQGLASARHIFVERSIAAEFAERTHQCVGFLDVDDPSKRPTDLGPLISLEAAQRVEDQVGRALRAGAKLILGGRRFQPSGLPGHFFQPTLLMLRDGAPAPEAISGPVITMTPVRDLAEGLRLAGEARPGFGGSIYTRDVPGACALARHQAGAFRINDPPRPGAAGPFSGLRQREIREALRAAPQGRSTERSAVERSAAEIEAASVMERKPWWFPYADRVTA